jgi:hypothetical protein
VGLEAMISFTYYRLAEYKIIEREDGYISWEAHSGFCSLKAGRGFINGDILFLEPGQTSEENGFLKGEFLDQLNRLPKWGKTKYYCTSFNIFRCKAGQETKPSSANNDFSQPEKQEDVSSRLGQFEIIEKRDGRLLWKSYIGRETMKLGKAFVHGNILFLGRADPEKTSILKKDFLERLLLTPPWEKTNYFCQQYTLYNCGTNTTCTDFDENYLPKNGGNGEVVFRKKFPRAEFISKQKTATGILTPKNLKALWSFCVIMVLVILKMIFWISRIAFQTIKLSIEVCALGCRQLKKWILGIMN